MYVGCCCCSFQIEYLCVYNFKDNDTALHLAARADHTDVVELLISVGLDASVPGGVRNVNALTHISRTQAPHIAFTRLYTLLTGCVG